MARYLSDEQIADIMLEACNSITVDVEEPPAYGVMHKTSYYVDGVPMKYIAADVISLVHQNALVNKRVRHLSVIVEKAVKSGAMSPDMMGIMMEMRKALDEIKVAS